MENNSLYHHGVRGQRWGVRRYQNKDGTLTPLGKKRLDRDIRENNAKKKDNRISIDPDKPDVRRWAKEDTKRTKDVVDSTSGMVKELKNIESTTRPTKRPTVDLSKMSDKELRDQINRANLERQYNDIVNPPRVSKGREYTMRTLETAGTVLAVTSSALGIALAIKELRG